MSKDVKIIVAVKNIRGTSFVGVRNYANKEGEISNQTFLVGITYENVLKADFDALKAFNVETLAGEKLPLQVLTEAYNELILSLEKRLSNPETKAALLAENDPTMVRSKAQVDAYDTICKGVRAKDGILYVYGLMVRKTVLQPIEYKPTNSSLKTVAKNAIKKAANLKELKFKNFKLGEKETLKITGIEI